MTRVSISYPPPSPLPPKARDLIISTLITTSAVKNLNSTLLATCQSTGWLDAVRQRALQLLRSGECTTFREVMDVLTREIWEELDRKKSDTSQIRNFISSHKRIEGEYREPLNHELNQLDNVDPSKIMYSIMVNGSLQTQQNGIIHRNDHVKGNGVQSIEEIERKDEDEDQSDEETERKNEDPRLPSSKVDVRMPKVIVNEGIRVVKEVLANVMEIPNLHWGES